MKCFLLSIVLLFSCLSVSAQGFYNGQKPKPLSLEVSNLTIRSINGWQTGVSAGLRLNQRLGADAYYVSEFDEGSRNSAHYGAEFYYTINPYSKLQLHLNLRIGVFDEQFVAVLPGIAASWFVTPRVFLKSGLSRSDGYPFFTFQAGIRVFGGKS